MAAAVLLAPPPPAGAHTDLVSTYPQGEGTALEPVSTVWLQFAGPVVAELTHVAVRGAGEVRVGDPSVRGTRVEVGVDGFAVPGEYQVAYRTVAEDGHPVVGSYVFEVSPQAARAAAREAHPDPATPVAAQVRGGEPGAAPGAAPSAASAAQQAADDEAPTAFYAGGVVLLALAAAAGLRRFRMRRPQG
jgi:methionine-rich copper-binding protein CopC